ncbi:methionine biosynthesis protein MetW [Chitinophaga solisilvae]|uniref:Methyltransferase domain-containing protein n=1 Tax=Chitinophaga solisilvae TaxID=1233460 RepID=A0A3S1D0V1_9BACT|nr:methionine biosynthesis protein MetW [Chitinophaga solisilvae]NSL85505.1 methyltransferase domain-containing protein [Chitinophaga solisilvae]
MANDNRSYKYNSTSESKREEFTKIMAMIDPGSKVVDLGCGDGTLLRMLKEDKQCSCKGMELVASGVEVCRERGLDVVQGRIDERLPYADNEFDVAICNVTIQMVMYPEVLLSEMKRISKRQIITFPNFAYFRNRLEMLFSGRMPKKMLFGYYWYSTGHIHQLSLRDFKELVTNVGGLKINRMRFMKVRVKVIDKLGFLFPNLFRKLVIFETERV